MGDREVNNLMFTTVCPQHYLELGIRGEIINVQYIVETNEANPDLLILRKRILFNTFSNEVQTLSPGQKLVQGILLPVEYDMTEEIPFADLYDRTTQRGDGGFGSTGDK